MNSEQTVADGDMGHLSNGMSQLDLALLQPQVGGGPMRCRDESIPVPMQQTLQSPIVQRNYNQDLPPETNLSQQGPHSQAGGPPISAEMHSAKARLYFAKFILDMTIAITNDLIAANQPFPTDFAIAKVSEARNEANAAATALEVLTYQEKFCCSTYKY